jgi:TolB-like protein
MPDRDPRLEATSRSESLETELAALDAMLPNGPAKGLRDQLQQSMGSAYTLERELGGGGMSRVFVATENALHRRVVVKILSPQLAQGISADRFAREIELAANLQDPHIVPVLNTGVSGTLPWFTMPYIEGESLRARLLRGPLSYPEALGILRDVAMALEYAHGRGVVHRDIKPENVLLAGRTAVVADFGIAKALTAARTEIGGASATLTSVGQSLGTPAYMAPEQASGDPVDHRADIYAWGIMAWELLAGKHPFADKSTTQQIIVAHLTEKPQELAAARPGVTPPLAAFVMRCLEKQPGDRPASASAIIEVLDGMVTPGGTSASAAATRSSRRTMAVAAAALLALLGTGGMLLAYRGGSASAAADGSHTIAVLPFENLGDSADAYFVDGMTDAVRSKLTGLPAVEVIARASSMPYARSRKTPQEIARELGVRYLLTGTVRFAKSGGVARVQVSPALVEVGGSGAAASKWEQPFDAEMADVFKVQGAIAEQVVTAMRLVLDGGSRSSLTSSLTTVPAAYDAYLRGQAAWDGGARSDAQSLRRAIPFLEAAVELDPKFVGAWATLGRARLLLFTNSARDSGELRRSAVMAIERAFAMDSSGPEGLRARASLARAIDRDYPRSLELLERARRITPGDAGLIGEISGTLGEMGRFEEALQGYEQAARLDPRSMRPLNSTMRVALRTRDIAAARTAGDRAEALDPTNVSVLPFRIMAELAEGNLAGARTVIARTLRNIPAERLAAHLGQFYELGWTLPPELERVLLGLDVAAFDGNHANRAIVFALQYHWRGDQAMAQVWADSAAKLYDASLRRAPNDTQIRLFLGMSLAIAGKRDQAVRDAREALAIQGRIPGIEWSQNSAYVQNVAAQVAAVAGDRTQALEWLAEAQRKKYYATPAMLRLDPSFKSLHGDPRFERVLAESR